MRRLLLALSLVALALPAGAEVTTRTYPLPRGGGAPHDVAVGADGIVWDTAQRDGKLGGPHPAGGKGEMKVWDAPHGRGPYGIATTPDGDVYYASLAGSHIVRLDLDTGAPTVIEPPTKDQGARRVWSDSRGRIWVSEWNSGNVSVYDPKGKTWKTWRLPGDSPRAYAVYVDEQDVVWLSDFGANAIVRFEPATEKVPL